ncbi:class I SAM-dependent methyltransferase [Dysgonomonas sp. 216]|uniref:class I SAM-dependent methyltransferase n=1 Tax=Dysgonomonas sp. 216 TaxID=2302934 RepID=UPI0013D8866B|nr:class I SAM-dependent methyltransferase [Dysgonomonas sp. 216]NDW17626.1 class I SAM-dependent methyltransferase [Dysgonomonas sp. 216]
MTTVHIDTCPVCGNNKFTDKLKYKDYLASGEEFTILECDKCGFAFTQNFPSEDVIGRYYDAPEYVSHSDTQKGFINTLYHIVRKITLKSKSKLVIKNSGIAKGEILDIGTGTGYFLNRMKECGWTVTGIEKEESAREYAKDKFGMNFHESEHLFNITAESKNAVSMWHVLEHVEQLNETMSAIRRILKPDGTAIIALPNKKSADANCYKKYWAAYDVPRHLWHFSPEDFRTLAEKHGFSVIKMKPMYFDVFYISLLSEKNKKTILASLVGLIKGGFLFLQSLSGITKCSSVVYILKKN